MITVFTPVYNRANLIGLLYKSLKCQTFTDFEWLIIDDGSSDDIKHVIHSFIEENILNIRFYTQKNGGKHRAINNGVKHAKGDLFFIVDSDDTIKTNALEQLNKYYQQIKENDNFAGVSGYRCDENGNNIYHLKKMQTIDCSHIEYGYKYEQKGGLAEAFKTKVMLEFPFPDYINENFCAESLIWNRISKQYKIRIFPIDIYIWNCLEDGLTKGSIMNKMKSPTYAMTIYSELLQTNIPILGKIKSAINYWRFYFCRNLNIPPSVSVLWSILMPLGYLLHLKDNKLRK